MDRSNTNSRLALCNALEILGLKTYHGQRLVMQNPHEFETWLKAIHGKFDGVGNPFGARELDQLLGNYQVVADLPAILFVEELLDTYPDALVILTHRDLDLWYE